MPVGCITPALFGKHWQMPFAIAIMPCREHRCPLPFMMRKTVSGLLKLLYPHGDFDKEAVERCFAYALENRRRVKEQLKKIGGMEFYDVHFSYIDNETLEEKFVSVPEQGGGSLIPEGPMKPGTMHTVALGAGGHLGLYRLELQVVGGNGKLSISGSGANTKTKEAIKIAFDYFKANITRVSSLSKVGDHDYHLHVVDIHNSGAAGALTLCSFVLRPYGKTDPEPDDRAWRYEPRRHDR